MRHSLLQITTAITLSALFLTASAALASPVAHVACIDSATNQPEALPQYLAQFAGHPEMLNSTHLQKRYDEMKHLFARLGAKVETPAEAIRYRELPMQDTVLPMTPLKKVFPDYNPESEFIIGLQEGNAEGRPHSYMLVGGLRFDGALFGDPSWEPRSSNLIIRGLVFRVRHVPHETILKLTQALESGDRVRDLTCYTSIARFLETKAGVKLLKDQPGLPLLPSEVVAGLLQDRLRLPNGKVMEIQTVNLTPVPFNQLIDKFLVDENELITLLEPLVKDLKPTTADYHDTLGWN